MALHPLMKPSSWVLWSGSGGLPAVHRAAAAFWLAGAAMLAAWVASLLHEFVVGGASPLLLLSGLSVSVGWAWLAWSTWAAWRADQAPLTLMWTGPVREEADQATGRVGVCGGFRLLQWDAPVAVEVKLDTRRCMLLRVQSVARPAQVSWLWLGPSHAHTFHHLRSLAYLPAHLTVARQDKTPLENATRGRRRQAVASWAHASPTASPLRLVRPPRAWHASGAPRAGQHVDSSFPSTVAMFDHDGEHA